MTAEIKFIRGTAKYSLLDCRRDENILEELKVDPVETELAQYRRNWLNHVSRMEDIRYPNTLTIDLPKDEDLDDR
jgi:hypothetical protein